MPRFGVWPFAREPKNWANVLVGFASIARGIARVHRRCAAGEPCQCSISVVSDTGASVRTGVSLETDLGGLTVWDALLDFLCDNSLGLVSPSDEDLLYIEFAPTCGQGLLS